MASGANRYGIVVQEGEEAVTVSGGIETPVIIKEDINWQQSPFYLGNFFTKLPENASGVLPSLSECFPQEE